MNRSRLIRAGWVVVPLVLSLCVALALSPYLLASAVGRGAAIPLPVGQLRGIAKLANGDVAVASGLGPSFQVFQPDGRVVLQIIPRAWSAQYLRLYDCPADRTFIVAAQMPSGAYAGYLGFVAGAEVRLLAVPYVSAAPPGCADAASGIATLRSALPRRWWLFSAAVAQQVIVASVIIFLAIGLLWAPISAIRRG